MLRVLDKREFLGIGFWEFGIKSMARRLGAEVIGKLFLSHPIQSIKGYLRYRQHHMKKGESIDPYLHAYPHLILLGAYCQKPAREGNLCPSGRFSHRCQFIESLMIYPACRHCDIRKMAELAMLLGCHFYIMTSSVHLLQHVFLPALCKGIFSHFLVMICPYAKELFLFPAFISSMEGYTLTLGKESCRNYRQFLLADEGHKPSQTYLLPSAQRSLHGFYKHIKFNFKGYHRLIWQKCIYTPSDEVGTSQTIKTAELPAGDDLREYEPLLNFTANPYELPSAGFYFTLDPHRDVLPVKLIMVGRKLHDHSFTPVFLANLD